MAKPFEIDGQLEVAAAPEQIWDAITTGQGMDAWFMGRNHVEPGEGGTVRTVHPGFTMESTITAWEPPRRFAHQSPAGPDGTRHSFDYSVDQRGPGDTVIRWLHTGVLGGDDWAAEYEAMGEGDPMYFNKLAQYVTYFLGRTATPVDAFGPNVPDREKVWPAFHRGLGLPGSISLDEKVRLTPNGFPPIEGVVDSLSRSFLGVRSEDALYRFIHGFEGTVMVGHHLFSEGVDQKQAEQAWGSWLAGLFD
jgi:uncharacterized protein YndB with AHSA1/START domain